MSNKNQNYLDKRNKKNIRRSKLPVSIVLSKLRPKSFSKICRDNLEVYFKGKYYISNIISKLVDRKFSKTKIPVYKNGSLKNTKIVENSETEKNNSIENYKIVADQVKAQSSSIEIIHQANYSFDIIGESSDEIFSNIFYELHSKYSLFDADNESVNRSKFTDFNIANCESHPKISGVKSLSYLTSTNKSFLINYLTAKYSHLHFSKFKEEEAYQEAPTTTQSEVMVGAKENKFKYKIKPLLYETERMKTQENKKNTSQVDEPDFKPSSYKIYDYNIENSNQSFDHEKTNYLNDSSTEQEETSESNKHISKSNKHALNTYYPETSTASYPESPTSLNLSDPINKEIISSNFENYVAKIYGTTANSSSLTCNAERNKSFNSNSVDVSMLIRDKNVTKKVLKYESPKLSKFHITNFSETQKPVCRESINLPTIPENNFEIYQSLYESRNPFSFKTLELLSQNSIQLCNPDNSKPCNCETCKFKNYDNSEINVSNGDANSFLKSKNSTKQIVPKKNGPYTNKHCLVYRLYPKYFGPSIDESILGMMAEFKNAVSQQDNARSDSNVSGVNETRIGELLNSFKQCMESTKCNAPIGSKSDSDVGEKEFVNPTTQKSKNVCSNEPNNSISSYESKKSKCLNSSKISKTKNLRINSNFSSASSLRRIKNSPKSNKSKYCSALNIINSIKSNESKYSNRLKECEDVRELNNLIKSKKEITLNSNVLNKNSNKSSKNSTNVKKIFDRNANKNRKNSQQDPKTCIPDSKNLKKWIKQEYKSLKNDIRKKKDGSLSSICTHKKLLLRRSILCLLMKLLKRKELLEENNCDQKIEPVICRCTIRKSSSNSNEQKRTQKLIKIPCTQKICEKLKSRKVLRKNHYINMRDYCSDSDSSNHSLPNLLLNSKNAPSSEYCMDFNQNKLKVGETMVDNVIDPNVDNNCIPDSKSTADSNRLITEAIHRIKPLTCFKKERSNLNTQNETCSPKEQQFKNCKRELETQSAQNNIDDKNVNPINAVGPCKSSSNIDPIIKNDCKCKPLCHCDCEHRKQPQTQNYKKDKCLCPGGLNANSMWQHYCNCTTICHCACNHRKKSNTLNEKKAIDSSPQTFTAGFTYETNDCVNAQSDCNNQHRKNMTALKKKKDICSKILSADFKTKIYDCKCALLYNCSNNQRRQEAASLNIKEDKKPYPENFTTDITSKSNGCKCPLPCNCSIKRLEQSTILNSNRKMNSYPDTDLKYKEGNCSCTLPFNCEIQKQPPYFSYNKDINSFSKDCPDARSNDLIGPAKITTAYCANIVTDQSDTFTKDHISRNNLTNILKLQSTDNKNEFSAGVDNITLGEINLKSASSNNDKFIFDKHCNDIRVQKTQTKVEETQTISTNSNMIENILYNFLSKPGKKLWANDGKSLNEIDDYLCNITFEKFQSQLQNFNTYDSIWKDIIPSNHRPGILRDNCLSPLLYSETQKIANNDTNSKFISAPIYAITKTVNDLSMQTAPIYSISKIIHNNESSMPTINQTNLITANNSAYKAKEQLTQKDIINSNVSADYSNSIRLCDVPFNEIHSKPHVYNNDTKIVLCNVNNDPANDAKSKPATKKSESDKKNTKIQKLIPSPSILEKKSTVIKKASPSKTEIKTNTRVNRKNFIEKAKRKFCKSKIPTLTRIDEIGANNNRKLFNRDQKGSIQSKTENKWKYNKTKSQIDELSITDKFNNKRKSDDQSKKNFNMNHIQSESKSNEVQPSESKHNQNSLSMNVMDQKSSNLSNRSIVHEYVDTRDDEAKYSLRSELINDSASQDSQLKIYYMDFCSTKYQCPLNSMESYQNIPKTASDTKFSVINQSRTKLEPVNLVNEVQRSPDADLIFKKPITCIYHSSVAPENSTSYCKSEELQSPNIQQFSFETECSLFSKENSICKTKSRKGQFLNTFYCQEDIKNRIKENNDEFTTLFKIKKGNVQQTRDSDDDKFLTKHKSGTKMTDGISQTCRGKDMSIQTNFISSSLEIKINDFPSKLCCGNCDNTNSAKIAYVKENPQTENYKPSLLETKITDHRLKLACHYKDNSAQTDSDNTISHFQEEKCQQTPLEMFWGSNKTIQDLNLIVGESTTSSSVRSDPTIETLLKCSQIVQTKNEIKRNIGCLTDKFDFSVKTTTVCSIPCETQTMQYRSIGTYIQNILPAIAESTDSCFEINKIPSENSGCSQSDGLPTKFSNDVHDCNTFSVRTTETIKTINNEDNKKLEPEKHIFSAKLQSKETQSKNKQSKYILNSLVPSIIYSSFAPCKYSDEVNSTTKFTSENSASIYSLYALDTPQKNMDKQQIYQKPICSNITESSCATSLRCCSVQEGEDNIPNICGNVFECTKSKLICEYVNFSSESPFNLSLSRYSDLLVPYRGPGSFSSSTSKLDFTASSTILHKNENDNQELVSTHIPNLHQKCMLQYQFSLGQGKDCCGSQSKYETSNNRETQSSKCTNQNSDSYIEASCTPSTSYSKAPENTCSSSKYLNCSLACPNCTSLKFPKNEKILSNKENLDSELKSNSNSPNCDTSSTTCLKVLDSSRCELYNRKQLLSNEVITDKQVKCQNCVKLTSKDYPKNKLSGEKTKNICMSESNSASQSHTKCYHTKSSAASSKKPKCSSIIKSKIEDYSVCTSCPNCTSKFSDNHVNFQNCGQLTNNNYSKNKPSDEKSKNICKSESNSRTQSSSTCLKISSTIQGKIEEYSVNPPCSNCYSLNCRNNPKIRKWLPPAKTYECTCKPQANTTSKLQSSKNQDKKTYCTPSTCLTKSEKSPNDQTCTSSNYKPEKIYCTHSTCSNIPELSGRNECRPTKYSHNQLDCLSSSPFRYSNSPRIDKPSESTENYIISSKKPVEFSNIVKRKPRKSSRSHKVKIRPHLNVTYSYNSTKRLSTESSNNPKRSSAGSSSASVCNTSSDEDLQSKQRGPESEILSQEVNKHQIVMECKCCKSQNKKLNSIEINGQTSQAEYPPKTSNSIDLYKCEKPIGYEKYAMVRISDYSKYRTYEFIKTSNIPLESFSKNSRDIFVVKKNVTFDF